MNMKYAVRFLGFGAPFCKAGSVGIGAEGAESCTVESTGATVVLGMPLFVRKLTGAGDGEGAAGGASMDIGSVRVWRELLGVVKGSVSTTLDGFRSEEGGGSSVDDGCWKVGAAACPLSSFSIFYFD